MLTDSIEVYKDFNKAKENYDEAKSNYNDVGFHFNEDINPKKIISFLIINIIL